MASGWCPRPSEALGGRIAVGPEVVETHAGDVLHEVDLVLDLSGLPLLGTHERQAHARAGDATEPMQDVLRRDRTGNVRHGRAHERLERLVGRRGALEVTRVDGIHDVAVGHRSDVRRHADEPGGADREARQHKGVVAAEVVQVGLVEHATHLRQVALGVLDNDVRVL